MTELSGKAALVTGASRGVGLKVAAALAEAGVRVVAVARSFGAPFGAEARPLGVHALGADLLDAGVRASVVPRALEVLGALDLLVNNAGIVRYARLADASDDDVRAQFELNVFAPHQLAVQALPSLRATKGAVINVASTLAFRTAPMTGAYGGTKAALVAMTKTLAVEEAAHGVRANVVAPGILDTDMISGRDARTGIEADRGALGRMHPLGRLGRPEEVAEAVLFLARSPWTTGSVLTIDGGLSV